LTDCPDCYPQDDQGRNAAHKAVEGGAPDGPQVLQLLLASNLTLTAVHDNNGKLPSDLQPSSSQN